MAHINICVGGLNPGPDASDINIYGSAYVSGDEEKTQILWNVTIPHNSLAATANSAIQAAAIAAAEFLGFTVGALDKKTLYGSAIDL